MNGPGFGLLRRTLPETTEGQRFHVPDVRVGANIVATLAHEKQSHGVLMAAAHQRAGMAADSPEQFSPVRGGGVVLSRTRAFLARVTPDYLEGGWRAAWRNRTPQGQLPAKTGSR